MAVNVDIVYKTVLLILNQQQRGYMTPDEFNKTATQVQLTIFESYASDLNQQYRLPDNDTEYGDRVKNIEQKLQFFQKYINNASTPGAITGANPFTIDLTVVTDLYRLGSVMYQGVQLGQYSQRNEVTQLFLSPLTQPTENFPIYLYESGQIFVFPNTIIILED
jgi:anaerobic ribonucleoside-triphosphate reductase